MAAVIARIAILAAALAAIVVSAVWLNDAHSFANAQKAALAAKTPAEAGRAARLFAKNPALGPDTPNEAAEGLQLIRAGQLDRAAAVLEDLVRQEPRNVRAWIGLYLADRSRDPGRAAFAQRKIRELSPPVGP
jgi:Flp pilus assembly protein TadD